MLTNLVPKMKELSTALLHLSESGLLPTLARVNFISGEFFQNLCDVASDSLVMANRTVLACLKLSGKILVLLFDIVFIAFMHSIAPFFVGWGALHLKVLHVFVPFPSPLSR